ncbi:MAG: VOC family protein, partial [Chloroflexi bacterium]
MRFSIAGSEFFAVDENPDAFNLSPATLGGTSVRMNLIVDDPDGVMRAAIAAGAKEVFPMNDQPYGMR